jgi:hypothetical protein
MMNSWRYSGFLNCAWLISISAGEHGPKGSSGFFLPQRGERPAVNGGDKEESAGDASPNADSDQRWNGISAKQVIIAIICCVHHILLSSSNAEKQTFHQLIRGK